MKELILTISGKNVNITTKNILDIFSFLAKSYCKNVVFKLKSRSRGFVFGLDSQASHFLKTLLINGLAKWNTSITVICSKDLTVNLWEKICFQGTNQYQFWPYENFTQITEGKIILLFKDCMFVRHLFDLKLCQLFLVLKRASRKQILTEHFKITTI